MTLDVLDAAAGTGTPGFGDGRTPNLLPADKAVFRFPGRTVRTRASPRDPHFTFPTDGLAFVVLIWLGLVRIDMGVLFF